MAWLDQLEKTSIDWLLEQENPGVRYLALRDLLDRPAGDAELIEACSQAHQDGPLAAVLAAMDPSGYWVEPGPGYLPKYRSTVWSIILLAQLGASIWEDARIRQACTYLAEHALTPLGQFTISGAPSGTVDCLQGNLCAALLELGYDDPRLTSAFEWVARSVTGEGMAEQGDRNSPYRYYAYKCGPIFACGANNKLPCAWGAAKVMLAFSRLQPQQRTPLIQQAIDLGSEFFLSIDPIQANWPCGYASTPSQNWWKFGFPVFYVTDLLQVAEALVNLGLGKDLRMSTLLKYISGKQNERGQWSLEYDYAGKTWMDAGPKKQPNKWVTLRALRVLKKAGG